MNIKKAIVAAGLAILGAQSEAADLRPGAKAFLKVPASFFSSGKSKWTNATWAEITVDQTPEGVRVNGNPKWADEGFPSLITVTVKKSSFQKDKGRTEVQLEGTAGTDLKVFLVGGQPNGATLFDAVAGDVDQRDTFSRTTYLRLGRLFLGTSALKDLSDERMIDLARFAHVTASGTTLATTNYKDNLYLVVDIGSLGFVLNDLKFNQAQRVAYTINERLLTVLKAFGSLVADLPQVYGLALKVEIPHRSFADRYSSPDIERVEIYSPNAEIGSFAKADITSQALMDKSIVIAASNRIDVRLNQ